MVDFPDDVHGATELLGLFKKQIEDIDRVIFEGAGHPRAPVLMKEDMPSAPFFGWCAFGVAAYSQAFPVEYSIGPLTRAREQNAYFLFSKKLKRVFESKLGKDVVESVSDRDLLDYFFFISVSLVRLRVLTNPHWFPDAKLRTRAGLARRRCELYKNENDISAFVKLNVEIGLIESKSINPYSFDSYWTQRLVQNTLEESGDYESALRSVIPTD